MNYRTLDDLEASDKNIVLRTDFNVPLADGAVTDLTRIERALQTIKELLAKGARPVIISHFGRPKGEVVPAMSLKPVAEALAKLLPASDVLFCADCRGEKAKKMAESLQTGQVLILENLRFYKEEEKNDPVFAQDLASLGEFYVNDAFSCSHRAHASVTAITAHLPAFAGRLMQSELEALTNTLGGSQKPAAALIGGAKISSKLDVIGEILDRVDLLIIGGGMANTFLAAKGVRVGKSLCEQDLLATASSIMDKAEASGVEIVLPVDATLSAEFRANPPTRQADIFDVGDDEMILDIGPKSVADIGQKLEKAKTLLWNGPMGAFEITPFDRGTVEVAQMAANLTQKGALTTVAGGGDTVAALNHAGVAEKFTYISTAGGAFLEWLEGKTLPGVAALTSVKD